MMQIFHKTNWVTVTSLALLLVSVSTPGFSQQRQQQGLNFISEIKGNVEIKKPEWKSYQRAYGGETLSPSDKLRLAQGTSAKVICDNLKAWVLNSKGEFEVSKGCPSTTRQVLRRANSKTSPTRAGNDPTIPYLISPRNSAILTRQPTLRWNPVEAVTSYQVQVLGPDVNWSTQVNQPQIAYSGKQPLKPGSRYWVTITASNGVSNEKEEGRFRGFSVLNDADTQQVKTDIAQLQQEALSNESKMLALAHLYRSNDLNADVINLLEGLVKKGSRSTAVYQLLGSTYQQIGLNQLAKERYLTALQLAKAEKNLLGQAIIQASLGEVDVSLNQLKQALQWFKDAQDNYQLLGDQGQVEALQQKLDDLKRRIS
jgi:hypothetical protein